MRILPSIELRRGRAVATTAGGASGPTSEEPGEQTRLLLEAGATAAHVVDLDAAEGRPNQWAALARVLGQGLAVQFGGGVRSMVQAQKLLDLGVARVVVGTQAILNPAWGRELCTIFPGRIVLALDARGREAIVEARTRPTGLDVVACARQSSKAGYEAILLAGVSGAEGVPALDRGLVEEMRRNAPDTPLAVGGAVRTAEDLEWLDAAGVESAVLAPDAIPGGLDLAAAVRRHERGGRA